MSKKMGFSSYISFLQESYKYRLGFLPTEQSHQDTWQLSDQAINDLPLAIKKLKGLDHNVLSVLEQKLTEANKLSLKIKEVFAAGGRVFLCGCGATGRLSLLIESVWNREYPNKTGKVVSFMAGGDIALVQSVEGFEDHTEYGVRQLRDLGFSENDLLISSTEGGETPFVIGATWAATKISKHQSYFLFCNPKDILIKHIERSREIINHERVTPIELFTGPMGVAGSTRMQASTVLQVFISLALFLKTEEQREKELSLFTDYFINFDISFLQNFIEAESQIYKNGERLTYLVDEIVALNTFTDTTERAPTFSMKPFGHPEHLSLPLSLSYICLKNTENSIEAWQKLLARPPRALLWDAYSERITSEYLYGFDFSPVAMKKREQLNPSRHIFEIKYHEQSFIWQLGAQKQKIQLQGIHSFWHQAFLKMLLNIHSTLVMGRLGRYQNNLMTWVTPSNGKLVDRTARYVSYLLEKDGIQCSYEDIVQKIFTISFDKNKSVVLETYHQLGENLR